MIISLAPLQGFTEFPVRNAFHKVMGGIDRYYSPYLKVENDGSIRKKKVNDILPENNPHVHLIPQILVNNKEDFKKLHDLIKQLGYPEINLNLGCPYPMVANKKLGSGLLPYPEFVEQFFQDIFSITDLKLSVKFRSGYQSDQEIFKLIEIFNRYPFHELIFHPRIGKQLYKGFADIELFQSVNKKLNYTLAYNGDIRDPKSFQHLSKMAKTDHYMIGRGLLENPYLAKELKQKTALNISEKQAVFLRYHNEIYAHYSKYLSGDAHVLNKMRHLWEYFSQLFDNPHKVHKQFKKCKKLANYELLINNLIQ